MLEKVGICNVCKKNIFCDNGFLQGVLNEDKTLVCFSCNPHTEKQKSK